MAASTVSLAIDKLVSLLTREAKLLKGIRREVADIRDELESILAFLKDADSKAEKEGGIGTEGAKIWVKQVREVAYQIEDAVDEYNLHVAPHCDQSGIMTLVKEMKPRHDIASKIRQIKASLQEVRNRSERYQFTCSDERAYSSSNAAPIIYDPRVCSLFTEEAELVGIEPPRDDLISHLVSGTPQRTLISLVGMGGVGKTTLAKQVYNSYRVKNTFQCRAWITVSQTYDGKELLRSILKKFYEAKNESFPESIITMDELSLIIEKLKEHLEYECYLVVFDDVWETDFLRIVERGLLDNNKGSRILITTRKRDVANFCRMSSSDHVHQMERLPPKEAWELFCKKAFKFEEVEGRCPKELKELSQDIVRKCEGLPLAIVVIGGLLATKEKSALEWQKFLNRLGSALVSDPQIGSVSKILSLSYNDLPYQLKPCLLYLGMFPEDFSIKRRRLIRLWIASGFVQGRQGMTLEEAALECLTELTHRNLIQIDKVNFAGSNRAYRIHDLLRYIILSKREELGVSHVSKNRSTIEGIGRHLSISDKESDPPKSITTITRSQTRSIMLFSNREPIPVIDEIFSKCKLLTTLDFENCPINHIPKELGNLRHLKYFSLRETNVSKLPKSIGKLHNLESLDLTESYVDELPVEINRFPKLRHLLAYHRETLSLKIHGSIRQLVFLQTLRYIRVDDDDAARLISEIGMLNQLRKLGIKRLKRGHVRELCNVLEKMTHLKALSVSPINYKDEILEVQSMSSPPLYLESLALWGQLERLPDWISKLYHLATLDLLYSRLADDSIKVIQFLPNLKCLLLFVGYIGEEIYFEIGGFQKLGLLFLGALNGLHSVIIDEGALPLLDFLGIAACPRLKEVPSGILHLKNLRELSFAGMTAEFTRRLSRQDGQDYWKVQHVPLLQYDGTYDPDDRYSYGAIMKRMLNYVP